MTNEAVADLIARSNRLGSDPKNTNYAGGNTSAKGTEIDPVTGEPVISTLLSATVVGPDATIADIYGTYFMVAGLEKSLEVLAAHPELDAFLVWSDEKGEYQVYATQGMKIVK